MKYISTRNLLLSVGLIITSTLSASDLLAKLATMHDPDPAQKEVRMYVKGDRKACLELYKLAETANNPTAQIHTANAYITMGWSKDAEKDFSTLTQEELESHSLAKGAFDLIQITSDAANPDSGWEERRAEAKKAFNQSAESGNAFAQLVLTLQTYRHLNFGSACKLYPLVQQQPFPDLLYMFGQSLVAAGVRNEQFLLQGLSYIEKVGKLELKTPSDGESFKRFESKHWIRHGDCSRIYQYGMYFISPGDKILAPSQEHWDEFKRNKLDTSQPIEASIFDIYQHHDTQQLADLIKKHKLSFMVGASSSNKPYVAVHVKDLTQEYGFKDLGEFTAESSSAQLPESKQELQPVITFIKDILTRSNCGSSASTMLSALTP